MHRLASLALLAIFLPAAVARGQAPPPSLDETGLVAVSLSPDGKTLASGSITGLIRLWSVPTGTEGKCFYHRGGVLGLAFSPDGAVLASLGGDGAVRVWNVADGKQVQRFAADEDFLCMTFVGDGKRLAAGRRAILVWELATGKELQRLQREEPADLVALAASGDGKWIAAAAEDEPVVLWDVEKATPREVERAQHAASLAFSPDGATLATLTRAGKLQLFDTASGEEQKTTQLHVGEEYLALAFSPDGKVVAFGKENGLGRYDLAADAEEKKGWKGGFRDVLTPVAFDPGCRAFAAAADPLPRLWDLASPARKRRAPEVCIAADDLQRLWEEMGSAEAVAGLEMVHALKLDPAGVTEYFKSRLEPVGPIPSVDNVIAALADADAEVRQTAVEQLQQLGDYAAPALVDFLDTNPPPAVRRQVERLLRRVEDATPDWDDRARLRSVLFLGQLKSDQAKEILERLADGDPKATLTRAAREALGRTVEATEKG